MSALYEMTEAARRLYELQENGDIPEKAVNDTLEAMGVEGKVEDYCCVIFELSGDIQKFENEKSRLEKKITSAEKLSEKLKAKLSEYMTAAKTDKLKAGTFALSFRKSEAVIVTDEAALPAEYIKTKTTTAPDKTAIKTAIKNGLTIAGAELQTNKNLQIK